MGLTQLFYLFLIEYFSITLVFAIDSDIKCNATDTASVEYEFSTDVINSEHIITFKGYYASGTRENYVKSALKNAGVSSQLLSCKTIQLIGKQNITFDSYRQK